MKDHEGSCPKIDQIKVLRIFRIWIKIRGSEEIPGIESEDPVGSDKLPRTVEVSPRYHCELIIGKLCHNDNIFTPRLSIELLKRKPCSI